MTASKTTQLRRIGASAPTLADAVDAYLDERDLAVGTQRVYGLTLGTLIEAVGEQTPLQRVSTATLRWFMAAHYDHLAPASWNRVVATLGSFFSYCGRQGWIARSPVDGVERRRDRHGAVAFERRRAIGADELAEFLNGDHPLRDKTLWWMAYETAARANEVLALDVGDLDLAKRRAVVIGKGGGAEEIGWETKTARLLPRLLKGRRRGPVFLADLAPAPARQPAVADLDPDNGRARLSYRRAAELFRATSGGWTLHQLRHSRLTHLAEAGVGLPLLLAKSRHTNLATLGIYTRPTFDAVAKATASLDPHRRRSH